MISDSSINKSKKIVVTCQTIISTIESGNTRFFLVG